MRGPGADLHVIRLEQGTALFVPVFLQSQNNLLKSEHRDVSVGR